jgi:hypothetical protein
MSEGTGIVKRPRTSVAQRPCRGRGAIGDRGEKKRKRGEGIGENEKKWKEVYIRSGGEATPCPEAPR